MVGFSESQQVAAISKVFADSYKSPLSVIVLDNIERLLGGECAHVKVLWLTSVLGQVGFLLARDFQMLFCRLFWFYFNEHLQRYDFW